MPTPNTLFNTLQPAAVFPVTVASGVDLQRGVEQYSQTFQQHQQQQQQQQPLLQPLHRHGHPSCQRFHGHGHPQGLRHPSHAHLPNCQQGPDPAVMEFITKIGQIIIKARTVSRTVVNYSLPGPESDLAKNGSCAVSPPVEQQHQNMGMILQDIDLWRNSTPVHVNILHSAQHVLLERWVISFTPASASANAAAGSPACSPLEQSVKSPYGYHSPKTKQHTWQHQHHQTQCICSPSSCSSASPPKDTTDLVLLLQSLYTQIRSLPLQNCLTCFDDNTRITKADLGYSVTSANEDITQPRLDKTIYCSTPPVVGQQSSSDAGSTSTDEPYTEFATSLRSTLPLEFVQAASLKVINFEASHMQWGCVRVTGMYDESVGGRIAPEDFQDSSKVQKRRHHRSKLSTCSHNSDSVAKVSKISQGEQSSWAAALQPVKADTSFGLSGVAQTSELLQNRSATDEGAHHAGDTAPTWPEKGDRFESPPESGDTTYTRLQSLKRSSERLFSSLSSPKAESVSVSTVEERRQEGASAAGALQEPHLPINEEEAQTKAEGPNSTCSFLFPPQPSPPLSIPVPRGSRVSSTSPESHTEKTLIGANSALPLHRAYPSSLQYSPPLFQQYQHSHLPLSTSPLAHVITRRRSSRLSIVMNCNDDSPDPTRPQSPNAQTSDGQQDDQSLDDEESYYSAPSVYRRRGSLTSEAHINKSPAGQSPSRYSHLRRSSLTPSSVPHSDLFGSLVGSYEESILSGRMSTLPSKPLMFIAQIGVLANQDYKDCPPKLRCPKHVQLEFPAVFYDYESSTTHHHGGQHHVHHSHAHQHPYHSQHHHAHSSHSHYSKAGHSFGNHGSISPSFHSHNSFASSPVLNPYFSTGGHLSSSHGSGPGSASIGVTHSVPTAHDDPILPYVGNLDLDSGFRGARRFARMPGGMRIPLRGQIQVMIKNPNKTVVKVFLVPYDFNDMPPGTKTFLRQKYYSTGSGMGPSSTTNSSGSSGGGTLRYAIHLQFCCPAPGYVYLYRSIRVVFANRVPDGKESLRVVLEGLGLGSKTIGHDGTEIMPTKVLNGHHSNGAMSAPLRKLEERYVKMRKGEAPFTSSKRKKENASTMAMSLGENASFSSTTGLCLRMEKLHSHAPYPQAPHNSPLGFQQPQQHQQSPQHPQQQQRYQAQVNFDGQPYNRLENPACQSVELDPDEDMDVAVGMDMVLTVEPRDSQRPIESGHPFSLMAGIRSPSLTRATVDLNSVSEDDYKTGSSSILVGGTMPGSLSLSARSHLSPKVGAASIAATIPSSPSPTPTSVAPSMSPMTGLFPKESSVYLGTATMGRKEKSQILGL
ncbi:hypothetical protein BGX28_006011 [Mortierella sp. GBA30]|nr:hypothetical protein BGX28_006011 [Mortierella sp. GBA30]